MKDKSDSVLELTDAKYKLHEQMLQISDFSTEVCHVYNYNISFT